MGRARWGMHVGVVWMLLWSSSFTYAQSNSTAAEALFRAGRVAMQRQDYRGALPQLRESYRLDPTPGTLLNVGVCEEELGALADAWRHYNEVIHALPASDSRADMAKKRLSTLEPRLPRLLVVAAGELPEGLHVRVGETIDLQPASFGVALPMDPGPQPVVVQAPGRVEQRFTITLAEGQTTQLPVNAGAPVSTSTPVAQEPSDDTRVTSAEPHHAASARATSPHASTTADQPSTTARDMLLGASAVALVSAAVTGALALERKSVVDEHCTPTCDDPGFSANAQGRVYVGASLVSLAVALVTGAAGGYLWLSADDADDAAGGARIDIGTQGFGLSAHTQF